MSDIDPEVARAYAAGADVIGVAESVVLEIILAHAFVARARLDDAGAFPEFGEPVGPVGMARRILGELLDCGWEPPIVRRPE